MKKYVKPMPIMPESLWVLIRDLDAPIVIHRLRNSAEDGPNAGSLNTGGGSEGTS